MRKLCNLLKFIIVVTSFILGISFIMEGNIYDFLICLSVIPIIYVPFILKKIFKLNISNISEIIFIIFIFLAHFMGSILNFYNNMYCYDKIIHFLSGIVISFLAIEFLTKIGYYSKNIFYNIIFILGISSLVAVFWEYFEYISDIIFDKDAQNVLKTGVNDTMQDLIVATLGSILLILFDIKFSLNKYIKK